LRKKLNKKHFFYNFFNSKNNEILSLIQNQYTYTNLNTRKKIFNKDFDILNYEKNNNKFFNKFFTSNHSYINQLQIFFLKFHLKGILEREDISSMAASVELRVPYLDHNVVESSLNLKINDKLDIKKLLLNFDKSSVSNINKYVQSKKILKNIYYNKIPKEIISRNKIGFPVNLNQVIFEKKNKEEIFYTINSRKIKNEKIFDLKQVNKLFDKKSITTDPRNYQKSTSGLIFMIYNVSKFILKI
jgi:asparagine synthase (glutamine-hydrolysing)